MNTPPAQKETPEPIPVSEVKNIYEANIKKLPGDLLLKAILSDKAVTGAVGSLLFWGIINLAAWFYFKQDMMSALIGINAPDDAFNTLLYGGAVISISMLVLGLAGVAARTRIICWMDGISLLVLGIWNLAHNFLLTAALKPYGYTIENPGVFWIILGIIQIIWGIRQLLRFKSSGAMPPGITSTVKNNTREKLRRMVQTPVSIKKGRLKFSITGGFPFHKKKHFTMWLLPHKALCIENELNDYFEIVRKSLRGGYFADKRVVINDSNNITRKLEFEPSSLSGFNNWLVSDGIEDSKINTGPDSTPQKTVEARIITGLAPAENVIFNDYEKMTADNGSLHMDDIIARLTKKHDFDRGYVTGAIEKGKNLKKSYSDFNSRHRSNMTEDFKIKSELDSSIEEMEDDQMIPDLAPAENVIFNDFKKIVKENNNLQTKDILLKLVKKHDFNLQYVTEAIEKGIRKHKRTQVSR